MFIIVLSSTTSIQDFFEEYNCNCESYDNESLFEFFGLDVEDDVTPAIEAINSFCKDARAKDTVQVDHSIGTFSRSIEV